MKRRNQTGGFSLVELLVVISVIAVIAAIGIGSFRNLTRGAQDAKARRNAQTIALVSASAQASGNQSIALAADMEDALTIIIDGPSNGGGVFTDMEFRVSDLTDSDVEQAKEYLEFAGGQISYRMNKAEPGGGGIIP